MDEWGENQKGLNGTTKIVQRFTHGGVRRKQKGPIRNNQNCLTLHPWMSKGNTKRAYTEKPELSNVAPMDVWGENQKGLYGTTKIV